MSGLLGVRFSGPLVGYADEFAAELDRQGYKATGIRGQLFLVAHLSRWLAERGLELSALSAHEVAVEFFDDRRRSGRTNYRTVKALVPLLVYLRGLGVLDQLPVAELTPPEALLERYRAYLMRERGLAATTARGYCDAVQPFVAERLVGDADDFAGLTAGEVTAFVVARCPGQTRGSARMTVTGLRSLLGFCMSRGC